MGAPLLKVENLKTYFFVASGVAKAVDGVSFALDAGRTLGIVGESGSGKTITATSIIRLLQKGVGQIVDGSIEFDGHDMVRASRRELLAIRGRDIGVIFQDPMNSLDPVFRVGDQMVEILRRHLKVDRAEAHRIAVEHLKMVGIPDPESRMRSYSYELSGGMCQRVMIAMAISCRPKLLIADEPTTALDVTVQAQVLKLLKDLQKLTNTAILLITHNMGLVWEMCDTVMVMYAGKTVEYAGVGDLYKNAAHPYTWGLLDSIPTLGGRKRDALRTIPGVPPDLRLTGDFCSFHNRCPYARPECAQSSPPLTEIAPGHFVACHRQTASEHLIREEAKADA